MEIKRPKTCADDCLRHIKEKKCICITCSHHQREFNRECRCMASAAGYGNACRKYKKDWIRSIKWKEHLKNETY